MAVSNEQIVDYLQKNPGLTDVQIAADMDKFGVTPQQMASATGGNAADIQRRYDTQQAIVDYGNTKPAADTDWASKMAAAGWTDQDIARATGMPIKDVQARHQAANTANTLTDLQKQMTALQTAYTNLSNKTTTAPTSVTPTAANPSFVGGGAVNVTPAATPTTTAPGATAPAATSGVVYGPDGTMYSSAAAAIAAGVQNFSTTKPTGAIAGANTLGNQFINASKATTGSANPGGLIGNAQQQLFKNPVAAQTPGVNNPFLVKT